MITDKLKDIFKVGAIPVVVASLCCLSPLLLVIFGLASVSFAASLADVFYGSYKWAFRGVGIILLIISTILYFRKKGVCTLDQAKKRRNEILNFAILTTIFGVVGYMIFLNVIVHWVGVWYQVWK